LEVEPVVLGVPHVVVVKGPVDRFVAVWLARPAVVGWCWLTGGDRQPLAWLLWLAQFAFGFHWLGVVMVAAGAFSVWAGGRVEFRGDRVYDPLGVVPVVVWLRRCWGVLGILMVPLDPGLVLPVYGFNTAALYAVLVLPAPTGKSVLGRAKERLSALAAGALDPASA